MCEQAGAVLVVDSIADIGIAIGADSGVDIGAVDDMVAGRPDTDIDTSPPTERTAAVAIFAVAGRPVTHSCFFCCCDGSCFR